MDDYSYAAQQMKEAIISDYLKKHPGVQRHEVLTKLVNGRYVVGTIEDVFKEMQGRRKGQIAQLNRRELLSELSRGGDERYKDSLESIKNSERYIEWLSVSKFTGFSEQDKKEHTEFLHRQGSVCSKCALDLHDARAKFQETIQAEAKLSRSSINTLVLEYLQAVYGQLKAVRSIFKREVELGDWFANATMGFFTTQFSGIHTKPNPAAVRAIARAFAILRENHIAVPEIQSQQDVKTFDQSMIQLKEQLEKRRKQFEELNGILNFLEAVIEELRIGITASLNEEPAKDSSQRMAFTTRENKSR